MIIRLEHRGTILFETPVADIQNEIVIGRGHTCTWVIPQDDAVASSRHAAIFVKAGKPFIKDLGSTNGIYFKGKNISQKNLEPGDRISVGDCILAVDMLSGNGGPQEPSRLVMLSGPQKGRKYDLTSQFTIGSDPTATLVLLDMLVSKRHAEITVKDDGSCWIADLGSKNGSSVNGMPLRGDQERLLKDGDRIAIAQFEMLFQDGAVKHSNSQVWLRLGVIAATLVVVMIMYWGYQNMRASSAALVKDARAAATAGNFAAARALVETAATARHAARNEIERADLLRNLSTWETTVNTWEKAKRSLESADWVGASRALGILQAGKKDVWTWSESAVLEKERALVAKNLLDALTRANAALQRENADMVEIASNAQEVKLALNSLTDELPAYLVKVVQELQASQKLITVLIQENAKLDEKIQLLSQANPPYRDIIMAVEAVKKDARGQLQRRAEMLLEPVTGLARSFTLLNQMSNLVRDLKFENALAVDINLPSLESCAVDPRLSHKRQELLEIFGNVQATTRQVSFLYSEILQDIGRTDRLPPQLVVWNDDELMAQVMTCDTLAKQLPKRSRTAPEGSYDLAVGTEEFYEFLNALPETFNFEMADLPFRSQLLQAKLSLDKIARFITYMSDEERQWLLEGRLGKTVKECEKLLAVRQSIVQKMVDRAEASSGRTAIIAAGIALRLTDNPRAVKCGGQEIQDWVMAELRKLRLQLLELNTEYSRSMPERQIQIRGEILRLGLPGDPVVRRMWAARDAAGY